MDGFFEDHASVSHRDIAIIGIGCRMPGGISDPQSFWEFVLKKGDGICEVPKDRWDWSRFYHEDRTIPGRTPVKTAGFMKHWDPRTFDCEAFGLSPREVAPMDPQQRLALEVTYEALDDAGIDRRSLLGSRTAVIMGAFSLEQYAALLMPESRRYLTSTSATAGTSTMLSARLAYTLGTEGPCYSVDTACSSSLVAVHCALDALRTDACDLAISGGVNVMMRPEKFLVMSIGGFLSPDGRSKAFDARANGYGRGEGAGIVILKTLEKARADGDRIYAVIKGSGINQDGQTASIAVPNGDAQRRLIEDVSAKFDIDRSKISYIEAHGTGTPIGDPIECGALSQAVGKHRNTEDGPVFVGSVKANIGHLEGAAGVAGLIKSALTLNHRTVAPQAQLEQLNPAIDFNALNLEVCHEASALPHDEPILAAVNSFGYGGTNAHVMLETPPCALAVPHPSAGRLGFGPSNRYLLALSSPNAAALPDAASAMADHLRKASDEETGDIAWTSLARRSQEVHRVLLRGDSRADLIEQLDAFKAGSKPSRLTAGRALANGDIAFVYTGMGPQWHAMARSLLSTSELFIETANACDEVFRELAGWSLLEELLKDEETSRITETKIAQPANTLVQIGLTQCLRDWGIQPSAVVGHSVGEIGSAYAAGTLTLEQAMTVAFHRSRCQSILEGAGKMLAVGLSEQEALMLPHVYEGSDVAVAAINAPNSVTLAGPVDKLEAIAQDLESDGVFARILTVQIPYHSPAMDRIESDLKASLCDLDPARPSLPFWSTVTGEHFNGPADAHYWFQNARQPVHFHHALSDMIDAGYRIFLEVGPHPVLSVSIKETASDRSTPVASIATLSKKSEDWESLETMVSALHVNGAHLSFANIIMPGHHADLPRRQFTRERHWLEADALSRDRLGEGNHLLIGDRLDGPDPTWQSMLDMAALPWLSDHIVEGAFVFPAAGYIAIASEIAKQSRETSAFVFNDIAFERGLVLSKSSDCVVTTTFDNQENIVIRARHFNGPDATPTHIQSRMRLSRLVQEASAPVDLALIEAGFQFSPITEKEAFYAALGSRGLDYRECFQGVQWVRSDGQSCLAEIKLDAAIVGDDAIFPGLLDSCFQACVGIVGEIAGGETYVPVNIRELRFTAPVPPHFFCHVTLGEGVSDEPEFDIKAISPSGEMVAEVFGLSLRALESGHAAMHEETSPAYGIVWESVSVPEMLNARAVTVVGEIPDALEEAANQLEISLIRHSDTTEPGPGGLVLDVSALSYSEKSATDLVSSMLPRLRSAAIDQYTHVTVTKHAQPLHAETAVDPIHASIVGAVRVAANELAPAQIRTIDLGDHISADEWSLVLRCLAIEQEVELAIREGDVLALRITETALIEEHEARHQQVKERPVAVVSGDPGRIDGLQWHADETPEPVGDEIQVRVEACSLNFKDVLKVLGMLDAEAIANTFHGTGLGMEGAVTVTAVGPDAKRFKVGDKIVAQIPNLLRTNSVISETGLICCEQIPRFSPAENAAFPLVFMTAYHALIDHADVQEGDHVLIHAAAGGVGQAAIQLAKWRGAIVHATSGSGYKREYLRDQGCDFVYNSRTANFVEQVRYNTQGRGVDAVLNSIAGDVADKSFDLLAAWGTFVEIGKRHFFESGHLPLRRFNECLSYRAIDIDRMLSERKVQGQRILDQVHALLSNGDISLPPVTSFTPDQLHDAFRYLSQSKNIGKVVLTLDEEASVEVVQQPELFHRDAAYLVTGGTSGFGAATARWLADKGAGTIVLASRSGNAAPEVADLQQVLTAKGACVRVVASDVGEESAVTALIESFENGPPLKGVFHAAGILADGMMSDQQPEMIARVFKSKADAAFYLDQATRDHDLDHFVLFSSIAATAGNPGQYGYAAANAYLDGLAHERRAEGLPALSVNWGAIGSVGMAARDAHVSDILASAGISPIEPDDALASLEVLLANGETQAVVAHVDWKKWSQQASPLLSRRVNTLVEDDLNGEATLADTLLPLSAEDRLEVLCFTVAEILSGILQTDAEHIDLEKPLTDLGFDSLMAAEARSALSATGIQLSTMELLSGRSIAQLSHGTLMALNLADEAPQQSAPTDARLPEAAE